jgi:hypothetical protein
VFREGEREFQKCVLCSPVAEFQAAAITWRFRFL